MNCFYFYLHCCTFPFLFMLSETQIKAFTTFASNSCPSDVFFSGHSAWFSSMVGDTAGWMILHLLLHLLHISPHFCSRIRTQ
jgi:hypothetical protein